MKHIIQKIKNSPIDELIFLLFVFCVPLQTRLILNSDQAYIDYYFSYHKAIFVYLSDLLFITSWVAYVLFSKVPWKQYLWLIFPLLWSFTGLFHVEHIGLFIFYWLKLAEFFLIILYVKNKPHLVKPVIYTLLGAAIMQSILAVVQFHMKRSIGLSFLGEYIPAIWDSGLAKIRTYTQIIPRPYGTMPHPNVLGGFIALVYGVWLYVSRETKLNVRNWLVVSCETSILAWGLLVSFSRTAWFVFLVLTALFISYQLRQKAYKTAVSWSLIIIVSCGTLVMFYSDYVFPRYAETSLNSDAISYRSEFNNYGIEAISRNPLFGVGIGNYIPYLETMKPVEPWKYQPAHNIVLHSAAEIGLLGLIIMVFTLFKLGFTWNIMKKPLNIAILIGLIVLGSVDHYLITLQQGFLLSAILLGIVVNQKDVSRS